MNAGSSRSKTISRGIPGAGILQGVDENFNTTNSTLIECMENAEANAGLVFLLSTLGIFANLTIIILILTRSDLRRWSQGLLFHQAVVDGSRSAILLPLAYSIFTCQPVNKCSLVETIFLLLVTVSTVNLLTTVLNDAPIIVSGTRQNHNKNTFSSSGQYDGNSEGRGKNGDLKRHDLDYPSSMNHDDGDPYLCRDIESESIHSDQIWCCFSRLKLRNLDTSGSVSSTCSSSNKSSESEAVKMMKDSPQCIVFGMFIIWFASFTINLGPTFLSGALAANSESYLNRPSCPLIQGPYRHYILNFLWIFINVLCICLTIYHLYKLKQELTNFRKSMSSRKPERSTMNKDTTTFVENFTKFRILSRHHIESSDSSCEEIGEESSKRLYMFGIITMVYILCWGPLFAVTLFSYDDYRQVEIPSLGHEITLDIAFVHAFLNPVAFIFLHSELRNAVVSIFFCSSNPSTPHQRLPSTFSSSSKMALNLSSKSTTQSSSGGGLLQQSGRDGTGTGGGLLQQSGRDGTGNNRSNCGSALQHVAGGFTTEGLNNSRSFDDELHRVAMTTSTMTTTNGVSNKTTRKPNETNYTQKHLTHHLPYQSHSFQESENKYYGRNEGCESSEWKFDPNRPFTSIGRSYKVNYNPGEIVGQAYNNTRHKSTAIGEQYEMTTHSHSKRFNHTHNRLWKGDDDNERQIMNDYYNTTISSAGGEDVVPIVNYVATKKRERPTSEENKCKLVQDDGRNEHKK